MLCAFFQMEDYTMLYRSLFSRDLFPRDVFAEVDRLQRELQQSIESSPSIRGQGAFPAINVGATAQSVEVYAFAPGIKPETIEVTLDRGVLSIAGERASDLPPREGPSHEKKCTLHINERYSGRFRRVVTLPDDIDSNTVSADYRDGVLHISVKRREAAQPRRIDIH
jgi:HSP20 family protein